MGCSTSKDVVLQMEEQEKKVDNLLTITKELEQKLDGIQTNNGHEAKPQTDKANEVANLKLTIDSRFTKLEKNVDKLHTEFKLKLFEGIADHVDSRKGNNNQNESLDLDFAKERNLAQSNHYNIKTPQNERGQFYDHERIASYNQIKLDVRDTIKSPGNINDLSSKKNMKSSAMTEKDIFEDDDIRRIHAQVKNTMFKGTSKN